MSLVLRALAILLFVTGGAAWAATPIISNVRAVTQPGGTATLSADITASSGSPVKVFFDYGTTTKYGTTPTFLPASANANAETKFVNLTGLVAGTIYNFRVRVETVEGEKADSGNKTFEQVGLVKLESALHDAATGNVTLRGRVTAQGVAGKAFFEYSVDELPQPGAAKTAEVAVAAAASDFQVTGSVAENLRDGPVYNYRLVFEPANPPAAGITKSAKTNTDPKAVADSAILENAEPLTLSVLDNDTDAEDEASLKIISRTQGRFGTVTHTDTTVTYTPNQTLFAADTFRYTIEDGFTGTATATVTIRPLSAALAGTHGGLIRNASGKEVGYFRITATALGSFTGVVVIEGKSYLLAGAFGADGSFHGAASRDGLSMPVDFATVAGDSGTTISAKFAQGEFTSEVEFADDEPETRGPLAGRYTVELPGGGSTTTGNDLSDAATTDPDAIIQPTGTGWTALKVGEDGSVRVKGRLPDGRTFSTRGVLVVGPDGPQITFFDDVNGTRIVGRYDIGDTVTGTLDVNRPRSRDDFFPRGYETLITVNGARYLPPSAGGRIVFSAGDSGGNFTMSFAGGGTTSLSRNIRITDASKVKVLNGGAEGLRVKVESSSGRFTTKLTDSNDRRIKGNGVFVQGTGDTAGGGGVFKGPTGYGSIQISAGATPVPTPRPATPTPSPATPTPTPSQILFRARL